MDQIEIENLLKTTDTKAMTLTQVKKFAKSIGYKYCRRGDHVLPLDSFTNTKPGVKKNICKKCFSA